MSIALAGLHSQLRPYAEYTLAAAQLNGIPVQVTSVLRSTSQQQALRSNYEMCLAHGLVGKPIQLNPGMSCLWPANRPGDSAHEFGLAWDSVVPDEYWEVWNFIRRQIGWHVPPNDRIHAELPDWRKYRV